MFKKILTDSSLKAITNETFFKIGMDSKDLVIIILSISILFVVGIIQEKGISIREKIASRNIVIRFAFYYAVIVFIIIFGAYGADYLPVDPMYANY